MWPIFTKTMYDSRKLLLWLFIGFAFYGMITAALYPIMVEASEDYNKIMESMPPEILAFIGEHEASVTQIQHHSGLSQAMTSQHLKLLHDSNLVSKRREGTVIYYRTKKNFSKYFMTVVSGFDEYLHSDN